MTNPSKLRVSQEYLPCRDYGHTWLPYDAHIESRPRRIKRILLCGKCGTRRTQTLDAHYDIVGNSYSYPRGYVIQGRLSKDERSAIRAATTAYFAHGSSED